MKKSLFLLMALGLALTVQAQDEPSVILDNVVVTGTRSSVSSSELPATVTVIDRETLTQNQQLNILPTLAQQVPGLMLTQRGIMGFGVSTNAAGGLNLRGLSSMGQMLVLIDGHPQYQGIYGHPIADAYQTLMAERVEVLRGPASVLYGSNAMGGVINIVTRNANSPFAAKDYSSTQVQIGAGSYGTVQTEVADQLRAGRFYSAFAGQYSRTDNHRPRMGFQQSDGYIKLGYDIAENWTTFVDADFTHFNASQPGEKDAPLWDADQNITRGAVSASLENHYERTNGGLSVYSSFGRHKIDDGTDNPSNPTQRYFRSKDALTGFSLYQSARLFGGNRTTVGVDFQHIYGNAYYTSKATGEILATPNKLSGRSHRNEVAAYVEANQRIASWLTAQAGIRVDHHSISGTEWIPEAGLVFSPTLASELKLSASKGFRNPTMRELYLYPPSNTDLSPERLWNYELAWRQRIMDGRLNYGINIFYIKGDNMIQTVMQGGKPKNVNTGIIENSGVELDAHLRIDEHWSVNTNHSFLHMTHRVLAAPDYAGFLGVDYHRQKFAANVGLQFVDRLYTKLNTGKKDDTETFTLVNATVSYQVAKPLRLWVRGENLLAQKYEYYKGFPMPRATFMGGINLNF